MFPGVPGGCGYVYVGTCDGPIRRRIRRGQAENGNSSGERAVCVAKPSIAGLPRFEFVKGVNVRSHQTVRSRKIFST